MQPFRKPVGSRDSKISLAPRPPSIPRAALRAKRILRLYRVQMIIVQQAHPRDQLGQLAQAEVLLSAYYKLVAVSVGATSTSAASLTAREPGRLCPAEGQPNRGRAQIGTTTIRRPFTMGGCTKMHTVELVNGLIAHATRSTIKAK